MGKCSAYVGLDVHKETIAVAVRNPLARLSRDGQVELYYEAGSCGYGLYRTLTELGHRCCVVAPSLTPRKPGERVKTDRRDALTLARLLRSGDLTPVLVPGPEQEAIPDLTRAREDMKGAQLKARQRLNAFLLRHDRVYRERKSRWTRQHAHWLEAQKFAHPAQQIVFQKYVDAVTAGGERVAGLDAQIRAAVDTCLIPGPSGVGADGAARRRPADGRHRAGGTRRPHPLRSPAPADGLPRPRPRRVLLRH